MTDSRIRRARPDDVPAMVAMVHELADYERAPEQCHLTDDALHTALFAADAALFGHVAEVDGLVVGCALWFLNFSTWDGVHGVYLEDLYVSPACRGSGIGRALLAALAEECLTRGYTRLQWWVLHWNPATEFYRSLGAVPMDEWVVYRMTGDPLAQLAGS